MNDAITGTEIVIDGGNRPDSLSPPTGLLTRHLVNNAGYGPRVTLGISLID